MSKSTDHITALPSQILTQQVKNWRKNRPHGFIAKPKRNEDGSKNLFLWDCKIPGEEGTIWEGGLFPVTLEFPANYPSKPPTARFPPKFKHINCFDDGFICLSILQSGTGFDKYSSGLTIRDILMAIQRLLNNPNEKHITGTVGKQMRELYLHQKKKYTTEVKKLVKLYPNVF